MKRIKKNEAVSYFNNMPLIELGEQSDSIRKELHSEDVVTFIVDRNINYTNICINKCSFCAFYKNENDPEAYILDRNELFKKIDETISQGGTQILIQGGLHPDLDITFYIDLLKAIKKRFNINIHGFSPPEIVHIAQHSDISIKETIYILRDAGLDSIPGGGAEILSDRVRETLSPKKIKTAEWLGVMDEAHKAGMRTTSTMMFGSIEEVEDIVEHLDAIRDLQDRTGGFTAFIPWSFQPGNTYLWQMTEDRRQRSEVRGQGAESESRIQNLKSKINVATGVDYLRVLAFSRIYLDNIQNIQASWVTQGLKMAQVALRFGANDFGSTMIEENVVKAAGISYRVSKNDIINAIKSSGFRPAQRDTYYNIIRYFNGG